MAGSNTGAEPGGGPVRIDVWVWAVRMYKTRSEAANAVRAGHVKLNGAAVKPSTQVVPGDRVKAWKDYRDLEYEVVQTLRKRVGAPIARQCYIDHSPPPPPKEYFYSMPKRDRGAGRPTKKERREIDRLQGRR
ncbi:RNA-binding S4 domain-containing protein [Corynebacterium urinipleomorphum]|uniref:RNA-binding S4 domain-containing protein n=1 Tax=Corynebacterium urinipleomorphum TaxID=1852380 RepID=UPI000B3566F7|nr:RNA-binding S4 domain-containing protein [Corynebacterium urinipleomorphum]